MSRVQEGDKSSLPGVWDPCPGQDKQLLIRCLAVPGSLAHPPTPGTPSGGRGTRCGSQRWRLSGCRRLATGWGRPRRTDVTLSDCPSLSSSLPPLVCQLQTQHAGPQKSGLQGSPRPGGRCRQVGDRWRWSPPHLVFSAGVYIKHLNL